MRINNGKMGELIAIKHYIENGFSIYTPFGGCGECDFVAVLSDKVIRVEVKSTLSTRDNRPTQSLDLRRQRNNTKSERRNFDSSKSDEVFVINLITGNTKIVNSIDLHDRKFIRI